MTAPVPAADDVAQSDARAEASEAEDVGARDGLRLAAKAQDLLDRGDRAGARTGFVAAATAHRTAGRLKAALDACYLAVAVAPGDVELHLLLARLYLDRGWHTAATDKLRLLERLTELTGDQAAQDDVRRFVATLAVDPEATAAAP